jgi:hypothetical protein
MLHAVPAAHACISCTVCAATLRAVLRPKFDVFHEAFVTAVPCLLSCRLQKDRAQSIQVRSRTKIKRSPPSPSDHHHIVSQGELSFRAPVTVRLADELPRLQSVHGCLSTRCHGHDAAQLAAWRSPQPSACALLHVGNTVVACLKGLPPCGVQGPSKRLRLLPAAWRLHAR